MSSMKKRIRVINCEDDNITNSDESFSDTDENKKSIYCRREIDNDDDERREMPTYKNKNLDVDDVNIDNFTDSSGLVEKTYERSYSKIYEMKSRRENDHDDERRSKVSASERNYVKKNTIFVPKDRVKKNYPKIPKFLIALFLFVIIAYVLYTKKTKEEPYEKRFHDLKVSFKLEDQLSWKALNNSLSKQLFKNTELLERPAVIILVGTKEKSESFLMRLEYLISVSSQCRSWQPLKVDQQEEQLKSSMLGFLNEAYKNGVHCAKMGDIDQIPPALGPILHGLTDENNAPYKDMIYLFSLVDGDRHRNYEGDDQLMNMRKLDEMFVVDVLRGFWVSEMGEERFQALINRLTGTVIGIK